MTNPIVQTMNGVLAQSASAEDGAAEHGETIGLKHITAAILLASRMAAITARNVYEAGKQLLSQRRTAVNEALETARAFVMLARDVLKPIYGTEYNQSWDITGFVGSLATPTDVGDMLVLLQNLKDFFTANAPLEIASRNVTAAQAEALHDALRAANSALNEQDGVLKGLMTDRDAKFEALREVLRTLLDELSHLIDPLDGRWRAFGFNLPGAKQKPDAVEALKATLIGPTAAALKWDAAARAEYYHVFKRVQGVDEDYVLVGSPADLDFTIENLLTNAHIDIVVSAVNNGGEGERSAAVTIVTHA